MKRVLIITYYWPPTGGSGVQRWVKFCKYLPQNGWQPVVYTPQNPEQLAVDETLLKDIPDDVEVLKTRITEPYDIYRRLVGKKKSEGINPINNSGKKNLMQRAALWIRANVFIPDPRVSWVRPSVRFLREYLKDHPVDAVITTGPPQSMHLIGRGLKRTTGVKWIADFRDPWTGMYYFKNLGMSRFAQKRHLALEKSVMDEADAIISVTPLVQKDFREKTLTPVHLITNGFDEDDFTAAENDPKRDRFTLVHTGLFEVDGNPRSLWEALARRCSSDPEFSRLCEIRLCGKVDHEIIETVKEYGLEDNLTLLGYVPHDRIVVEQRNASLLMLPLRIDPEYRKVLPGKIFEYLAARRPILGIGQEDGVAAAVLKDSGAGEMFGWDQTNRIDAFIEVCWKQFRTGDDSPLSSDISRYSRRELTGELCHLLETL